MRSRRLPEGRRWAEHSKPPRKKLWNTGAAVVAGRCNWRPVGRHTSSAPGGRTRHVSAPPTRYERAGDLRSCGSPRCSSWQRGGKKNCRGEAPDGLKALRVSAKRGKVLVSERCGGERRRGVRKR